LFCLATNPRPCRQGPCDRSVAERVALEHRAPATDRVHRSALHCRNFRPQTLLVGLPFMTFLQRMATGPSDPSLIVTFGTDSEGSDEESVLAGGIGDNIRPARTATGAAIAAPSTAAISTGSAASGGASNVSSSGLPKAKVWPASSARKKRGNNCRHARSIIAHTVSSLLLTHCSLLEHD
jgi:hypothetical protein